jgi:transposase-like protein
VFTAAEKLRVVKEADRCAASGKPGAVEVMLRRQGLYSSLLSRWRTQFGAYGSEGLAVKKGGRKPKFTETERRNAELTKRNAELERKLHVVCTSQATCSANYDLTYTLQTGDAGT